MYASYFYNNGATVANIHADLVSILTGTTDVNTLSASCNKTSTSINNTITAAGWSVHDATQVAVNMKVLKAPLSDDGTRYKYVALDMNTMAAQVGYITARLYDKWVQGLAWTRAALVATVTHTAHGFLSGDTIAVTVTSDAAAITISAKTPITVIDANSYTFACLNAGALSGTLTVSQNLSYMQNATEYTYSQRWPTTTAVAPNLVAGMAGRIDISASARHMMFFSFQNGSYGSGTAFGPSGIMERTRRSPWDTVANGNLRNFMPANWCNLGLFVGATGPFTFCNAPNASAIDMPGGISSNAANVNFVITPFGSNTGPGSTALHTTPNTIVPNATLVPQHLLIPFGSMNPGLGHLGGDFSSVCDIWLTTFGYGGPYDELTIGTDTYVIWSAGSATLASAYRIAVRKG